MLPRRPASLRKCSAPCRASADGSRSEELAEVIWFDGGVELFAVDTAGEPVGGVVARDAIGQGQKRAQPRLPRAPEILHVVSSLSAHSSVRTAITCRSVSRCFFPTVPTRVRQIVEHPHPTHRPTTPTHPDRPRSLATALSPCVGLPFLRAHLDTAASLATVMLAFRHALAPYPDSFARAETVCSRWVGEVSSLGGLGGFGALPGMGLRSGGAGDVQRKEHEHQQDLRNGWAAVVTSSWPR